MEAEIETLVAQVARLFDDFTRRQQLGPGRGVRRVPQPGGPRAVRRPGRLPPPRADGPEAEGPRGLRPQGAPQAPPRLPLRRDREAEPRPAPQQGGREADREDAEGVLPQREDEAHQEGAGPGGQPERARGAQRAHREGGHDPGGQRKGPGRAQAPRAHAARLRGGHRLPLLHRLAPEPALVQGEQGQARHQARPEGPRRGPLRAGEGQGAHPRVPLREAALEGAQGLHPLLRRDRPAWARPPWPSPSRGAWGASSCASASAACTTRRRSRATAAPTSAPSRARSSSS